MLAAGLLVAAPGCAATYSSRGGYGNYRVDSRRHAYERGYDIGLRSGRDDARKGRRFDYDDHKEFRNADKGYDRRDGDRDAYRDAFRSGFMRGYSDAYRTNARNRDRDDDRDRSRRR
jgi:hypothetical protein